MTAGAQGEVIGEVVVRGASNIPQSSILATMRTKPGQVYQESQLNKDKQSIEAIGFFSDVKVYGQLLEDSKWRVVVEVVEWPKIREVQVEGNTVISDEKIIEVIRNKAGAVFNSAYLEPDAQAINELYRSRGYFARVDRYEPSVNDSNVVHIELIEARVNKIEVTGLKRTKRSIVGKLMDTDPGDLLHQPTWTDDLRRIVDTRWFDKVDPDSREPEPGKVDLLLGLQEGRTGIFNVGVQLDPRNRLAGFISLSESNLYGSGKSVGINVLQSTQGLGTSVSLDYGDPFLDERRTALSASIYSRETLIFGGSLFGGSSISEDERFAQRRTGATVSLSSVLDRTTRGIIGVRGERINTEDFKPDPGEEFIVQDGDIAGVSFGILKNRRDNSIDPSRGDWLRIGLEPSYSNIVDVGGMTTGHGILGPNFFSKFTVDYRMYFSKGPPRKPEDFDEPRRVVAARIFGGATGGVAPFFEQFFIGGANGVRGYPEDRFWGRNAILAQLEYRHPIQKAFNAVAFVDYGGAWNGYAGVNEFTQTRDIDLHVGYGIGINFRTAFGPIRLDIGFDERGRPRTHFMIGGSF